MRTSVIIPCHNGGPYVAATIASVLRQSVPAAEIVVVDDASTDDSAEIALGFGAPVRLVSGRYGSAAGARLAGLAAADERSEALMFLDADDLLGRDVLAALTATLRAAPGAIARCRWHRYELEHGAWHVRPPSCKPRRRGEDDLTAWLTGWYHPPCSVLWSREAYERGGGWDVRENVNDDGDMMMRALIEGVRLLPAEGGESFYRRLPEGGSWSSARRDPVGLESRLRVVDRVRARLKAKGRLGDYVDPLRAAYALIADEAAGHPEIVSRARGRAAGVTTSWRDAHDAPPKAFEPRTLGTAMPDPPPASVASDPLVSVVIPTYRRPDETVRAARSVLSQTYRNLELLVVDDASGDETPDRAGALGDPRLRLVQQERNQGVAAARNRGVAEAGGALIAFLDSDDEWSSPDKLRAQVDRLVAAPRRTGLCVTEGRNQHAGGEARAFSVPLPDEAHRALLETNHLHGACSSGLLRREVLDTIGGFDTSLPAVEDWEFWIRVARQFDILVLPEDMVLLHDEAPTGRRSRDRAANVDARLAVHALHAPALAEAGLAGPFLLETARRTARGGGWRAASGRRQLLAAAESYARSKARSLLDRPVP